MSSYGMPSQASSLMPPMAPSSLSGLPSLGNDSFSGSGFGGSGMGDSSMMGIMGMMLQIMQMLMMLLSTFLGGGMDGMSGGGGSSYEPTGGSGGGSSYQPTGGAGGGSSSEPTGGASEGAPSDASGGSSSPYKPSGSNGSDNSSQGTTGGTGNAQVVSGNSGFNSNVSVFCPVTKDQEASGSDNSDGSNQGAGFWQDMNRKFNSTPGISLTDAFDSLSNQPGQQKVRTNAPKNSFVKGGGGKILVIGGDGITAKECQAHAEGLAKAYGIPSQDVMVIPNCSPAQLKAKMQEMGQGSGQQVLVDVLAHGAKQAGGLDALGKGNGDQWLSGNDLKSWVNQYLSPSYKNVNLLIESCYSGNFVQ